MHNQIKLEDVPIQKDGVRSSQAAADIPGFVVSDYYSKFQNINDYSELNADLIGTEDSFEDQLNFSPLRANFLRAFDWESGANVLVIGSNSGAITYFFAKQNLYIDAIETNRQLAQLSVQRTRQFSNVRVFSQAISEFNFDDKKYDVIILNGVTDFAKNLLNDRAMSYTNALKELLASCKNLLRPEGQIFLAADNRQGLKYIYGATDERIQKSYYGFNGYNEEDSRQTLNLTQWRSLVNELSFDQIDEYYLFPDFRFTSVLLEKDYCRSNQYAFQHLEGVRSKDYFQYQTFGVNEILLYQAANSHGHLGDFANSCLFVLGKNKSNNHEKIDFAHLPNFKRKPDFISLVKKNNNEDFIKRQKLFDKAPKNDQEVTVEPYETGCQLSVIWRNSIISDHRGVEFQQCLLSYLDYVKKLDSGVYDGMNIDAIPNNIIVDADNEFQLIDREWINFDQEINADFVFYRAVVHFALRNESIFYHFNWLAGISTLGDFVHYCFRVVGLNVTIDELEEMRIDDVDFLAHVLVDSAGYQFTDEFGISSPLKIIYPSVSWSCASQSYQPEQQSLCKAKADNSFQQLIFRLPDAEQSVKYFRFQPFAHLQAPGAGYFGISSLEVRAVNEQGSDRVVLNLPTSDEVNQANIHDAIFYSEKDSKHVFMFRTHHTFLEFELPDYDLNENEQLLIQINFRLSPSHDYEIARHKFGLVERKSEESLRLKDEQFHSLEKKFKKQEKELEEMQASRIWRLLAAYRDTFKISGYPEKNIFGKIGQLVYRFKHPKEKQDK